MSASRPLPPTIGTRLWEGFQEDRFPEVVSLYLFGSLPGFRNLLVHEYVGLDCGLVLRALENLDPVRDFARTVSERFLRESSD